MEKLVRFFLYLFLLFSVAVLITKLNQNHPLSTPSASILSNALQNNSSLAEVINKSMEGTQGTYSLAIENLKTGEVYYKDEHKSYESASLYKLWVMAVTYRQIEQGKLKEDQVLSEDVTTLNQIFNIDPSTAELTEGTVTLSVSDALNQMITISHNYAALLLTENIQLSSIKQFLDDFGLKESSVGTNGESPTTTASDIALFYEKLYKGELANKEDTAKMVALLKAQTINNKLPKNLPQGVEIAHKTGEIDNFSHDGGIVYTPKGDYIIVVMSENPIPSGAEDRIAQVSKAVYDYFTR